MLPHYLKTTTVQLVFQTKQMCLRSHLTATWVVAETVLAVEQLHIACWMKLFALVILTSELNFRKESSWSLLVMLSWRAQARFNCNRSYLKIRGYERVLIALLLIEIYVVKNVLIKHMVSLNSWNISIVENFPRFCQNTPKMWIRDGFLTLLKVLVMLLTNVNWESTETLGCIVIKGKLQRFHKRSGKSLQRRQTGLSSILLEVG